MLWELEREREGAVAYSECHEKVDINKKYAVEYVIFSGFTFE